MDQGREFVESLRTGNYKHQSFNVELYLKAPIIVVPENIYHKDRPCLVVDTGAIEMKSFLVPYSQGIDYKVIRDPTLLYDRYELTLSNFHVTILEQGLAEGMKALRRGDGNPAIKEFSAILNILNCVEPRHPLYPTVEISIVIKNFEVLLSLRFLDALLRIKNSVILELDSSAEEAIFSALRK
jgi:hypothetical protein